MRRLIATAACALLCAAAIILPADGQDISFRPSGTPTKLSVTGTAQALTINTPSPGGGLSGVTNFGLKQILLVTKCSANELVFYRDDGVTAATSGSGLGVPILWNSGVLVSTDKDVTTLSVIGEGTSCVLYATPGVGR